MADAQFTDDVIMTYAKLAASSENNLVFVTQSGIISGKPIFDDEEVLPIQKAYFEIFDKDRISSKEEYAQSLTIKDVTISSSNVNYNLPYLTIFMDKVLGVSIGNAD